MRDDRIDRQIALDDLKKRLIDLTENRPELPAVAWDAEPVRYFKLNQEWCILLAGWLDHMESEAFWPDATGQDYPGIQAILKFEEGIELPVTDFDCGDVEDCLETSETIANLNTLINQLEEQINQLEDEIEELENEQETGIVDLPPNPTVADAGNDVCRGANFISLRLGDTLLDFWDKAKSLTLAEFVGAVSSLISLGFIPATEFWQWVLTTTNPDLDTEAMAYIDRIRIAFFCANWDKEQALAYIQTDESIPINQRQLWVEVLKVVRQGQLDEWGMIGTLETTESDCTGGCPWIVVYDFSGDYVPVGDETDIHTGDTWDVNNGDFVPGVGYDSNAVSMYIEHDLPEQCHVEYYQIGVAKPTNCARGDFAVWTKPGPDEGWSSEQFTLSNVIIPMGFDLEGGATLSQIKVGATAVLCGPGDDGSKIAWVKVIGTGNKPT